MASHRKAAELSAVEAANAEDARTEALAARAAKEETEKEVVTLREALASAVAKLTAATSEGSVRPAELPMKPEDDMGVKLSRMPLRARAKEALEKGGTAARAIAERTSVRIAERGPQVSF